MSAINGYIRLHRSLLEWEWWNDHNTSRLWIYLLMDASFKKKMWRGIEILPGQLVTSRTALAEKTGLSVQAIRTALCKLQSTCNITIQPTSKYSIVSIANWDKFQCLDNELTSKAPHNPLNEQPHRKNVKKEEYISTSQLSGETSDKQKAFAHDSEPYKAAKYLDKQICGRLQSKKPADERGLQGWALHFDRLNRIDAQSWEDIAEVLRFSQTDQFWGTIILSGKKFREKYIQLMAKMKETEERE